MTSKPAVVIRFPLEEAPILQIDAMRESEWLRIVDWLTAHPSWAPVVRRALELAQETRRVERANTRTPVLCLVTIDTLQALGEKKFGVA
jgi:hypothetical protein